MNPFFRIAIIFCVIAGGVLYFFYSSDQMEKKFLQIKKGDDISKVIELFGEPNKVTECNTRLAWGGEYLGEDKEMRCKKRYWYGSTEIEKWSFGFDENDKAISKYHHVSM